MASYKMSLSRSVYLNPNNTLVTIDDNFNSTQTRDNQVILVTNGKVDKKDHTADLFVVQFFAS